MEATEEAQLAATISQTVMFIILLISNKLMLSAFPV
jgi:hypothetical protein